MSGRATASGRSPDNSGTLGERHKRSGGWAQGDGEAEGLELADVVEGLAVLVDAGRVVVAAEVVEARGGVGEQVPDDDQDGAGDRDEGLELAAAFDQPPVALAEEGVGLGRGGGGFAEDALEVAVALAGLAGPGLGPGLDGLGGQLGPGDQVRGGGEPGHVQPDLGEDRLGGAGADAGDLVEAVQRRQRLRAGRVGRVGGSAGFAGLPRESSSPPVGDARRGDGGQQVADAGGEPVDLRGEPVDLVEQHPGELGVVVVEPAGQRLHQGRVLDPQPALGQPGQPTRVTLPGDQRLDHGSAGDPEDVGRHDRQLDQGVLEQLLQPLLVPGPLDGQIDPQPGVVTQLADFFRRHERGPEHAFLGQLGQPDRVELVGFRPPRDLFDVAGVDQPGVKPPCLQQVQERPPIIRGGLDHDPLDPLAGQVVGQLHDRVGGGRHVPHPGHPPARDRVVRHPRAHLARRLRHVDRGDPRDHLVQLFGVDLLRYPRHADRPPSPAVTTWALLRDARGPRSGTEESNRRARSTNA